LKFKNSELKCQFSDSKLKSPFLDSNLKKFWIEILIIRIENNNFESKYQILDQISFLIWNKNSKNSNNFLRNWNSSC